MTDLDRIDQRLARIEEEIEDLERQIGDLEGESEELRGAKSTILRYLGVAASSATPVDNDVVASDLSVQQAMVMRAVPVGEEHRTKPAEIVKKCRSLEASYVRTTLWRFAQDGRINSSQGYYWRALQHDL